MRYTVHYSVSVWILDENGNLIPGDDLTLEVRAESKIKAVKAFKEIYSGLWGGYSPLILSKSKERKRNEKAGQRVETG